MKIVHTNYLVVPEFDNPEKWLSRLSFYTGVLEALVKYYDVESIEKINYSGEWRKKGVLYHFIRFKNRKLYFPWRMHRFIKSRDPDIVLVSGFIFPLQIIQLRLKLGNRVKIIVINRSEKPFKGFKKYLQRLAYSCINAYLFPSIEFGKQWFENGNISDQKKIYEVMHGSSFFSPGDKIIARTSLSVSGCPIFLWVGRLNANKDPLTVVKAFIQFLKFQPGAKLYMIYHTEELLEQINDLLRSSEELKKAIILIGKLPHQEMQDWYRAADFIISGSHYEGGGIAVCEAMSCGCIPIMTDIISFRKFSGPGKCGFLYKAGDEKALLDTLLYVIKLDWGEEGRKVLTQFQKGFSFEVIATKIHDVISSL